MKTREEIQALAEIAEGVPIWGCVPGSPAANAGLRVGDIVVRVNNERVRTIDDVVKLVSQSYQPFEVLVSRDADLLLFVVDPSAVVDSELNRDEFDAIAGAVADGRCFPDSDENPR